MSTGGSTGGGKAAGGAGAPTGGSVSAVGLATVGKDNMLIIKMDQPIPPGTDETTLVIKITKSPAPAGGPTAAFCVCNSNHSDCGVFFF